MVKIKIYSLLDGECITPYMICVDNFLNSYLQHKFNLCICDPPFNINYKYKNYHDSLAKGEYITFLKTTIEKIHTLLSPFASVYFFISDEYAAESCCLLKDSGLFMRNWIIWEYNFGQHQKKKFCRNKTHILYFVKNPKNFTFNQKEILVPSLRQTKYNDKRAKSGGKTPSDVWHFPRVCGSFKERKAKHSCQLPYELLKRIILTSSCIGDFVLDPFAGSGKVFDVCCDLQRNYTGYEIESSYYE